LLPYALAALAEGGRFDLLWKRQPRAPIALALGETVEPFAKPLDVRPPVCEARTSAFRFTIPLR
jgi:hypothetical protein